ncbi:MAG: tRNA (adenosine(37)-N6)-dimethylallyltransferase MiaA [Rhodospirillales bacterium]|nr:tRNA (adenosine(37)-N6)-dimethylallyltransferase MiaA [Rhodospirillales bacterium]
MTNEKAGNLPPVLIVAGPTGSGKSALAMDAAEEFDGVVINADSMQVYRELRVLTARPSQEDETRVPHRLFGALPAAEACSAGRWQKLAASEIHAAHGAGRLPIVTGGTGLYLKALTEGLNDIPEVPKEIRDGVLALREEIGPEAFHGEVAAVDPNAAARIPAGDAQRLIRALEVFRATGKTLSYWQTQPSPGPAVAARFATLVLVPPRDVLYAALEARFDRMMSQGALDEVAALAALGLDPALPAMKALGVPELIRHLNGEISVDEAVAAAKQATRNFAKRQLTWINNQIDDARIWPAQYSERFCSEIFSFIRRFLLTGDK